MMRRSTFDIRLLTLLPLAIGGCALLKSSGTQIRADTQVRADADTDVDAQVEVSPEISAAVEAALASFRASLETDIAAVRGDVALLQARDVAIGGGGDSVTAWIYALIPLAAVFYPGVIRPVRKRLERRRPQVESLRSKVEG